MAKHHVDANVTEQPVSIILCGRELFHIHKIFPLLRFESILIFLFSFFWFLILVFTIWFSSWKFCSIIWHCTTEVCLDFYFLIIFYIFFILVWQNWAEQNCCVSVFPRCVYFPNEYLVWLNWKISGQTSCSCAIAGALVRLEKSRSALEPQWVNRSALVLQSKPKQPGDTDFGICRCVCISL